MINMITIRTKRLSNAVLIATGLLLFALVCGSCATYKATLKDQEFGGTLPAGTYTLIKHGGGNMEDFATFAIVVPENSGYKFDIFKPDFDYRTLKGVPAQSAMKLAEDFVRGHPEFLRTVSRAIIMPDGSIAGYEVRILYRRTYLGMEDLFDVNYLLRADNVIEVRIKLDDVVQKYIMGGVNDN
jgi:hypothetical protein